MRRTVVAERTEAGCQTQDDRLSHKMTAVGPSKRPSAVVWGVEIQLGPISEVCQLGDEMVIRPDEADLSFPGSSVVAESDSELIRTDWT